MARLVGSRSAGLAVVAALVTGCILFVDSSPSGDQFTTTCGITASSGACGACITKSCASDLSACCADTTCRPMLDQVDQCAEGGACTFDGGADAASSLVSCIASSCNGACNQVITPDGPSNGIECNTDTISGSCTCQVTSAPNTTSCNQNTFSATLCCADNDYATTTSSKCSCTVIGCIIFDTSSCACYDNGTSSTSYTCDESYGTCCAGTTSCQCGANLTCDGTQTEVASCNTAAAFACGANQTAVTDCR